MAETTDTKAGPSKGPSSADNPKPVLGDAFRQVLEQHCNGNAGLNCVGIVTGVDDRQFQDKETRATVNIRACTITDGKGVYFWSVDDSKGPLPEIPPFVAVKINVEWCQTDKGSTKVRGPMEILG